MHASRIPCLIIIGGWLYICICIIGRYDELPLHTLYTATHMYRYSADLTLLLENITSNDL